MTGSVICKFSSEWIPPVDFVLEMATSTSPGEIWAGTTWTQLKNCIIFAAGDTFRAGSSGGSSSVTLTTSNLPAHSHSVSIGSAGAHTHTIDSSTASGYIFNELGGSDKSMSSGSVTTSSAGGHGHTLYVGSTGSGQTFNIMNPYYAVNIWQRVG